MGALSALIVTACVAPALVGALLVISQGGDVLRGAVALFAMSMGMGAPLLVIGTSAGKLLPRAGAWMDTVKQLFGAMMLGVAAWMLSRLVSDRAGMLLYTVPLLAVVAVLWRLQGSVSGRVLGRAIALGAGVYALLLGVGAARGDTDPLRPLASPADDSAAELPFTRVANLSELDRAVQRRGRQRPRGDARFLCRLVRVLQGNGALHVLEPASARRADAPDAAARRRHGQQRR